MNERIRELAEQAGFMVDQSGHIAVCFTSDGDSEAKKFAELIINESASTIEHMLARVQESGPPPGYDRDSLVLAYNDCISEIKEHFGVEE